MDRVYDVTWDFVNFCRDSKYPLPYRNRKYCCCMRLLATSVLKQNRDEFQQILNCVRAEDTESYYSELCFETFQHRITAGRFPFLNGLWRQELMKIDQGEDAQKHQTLLIEEKSSAEFKEIQIGRQENLPKLSKSQLNRFASF